jgi:cytidine deaminase
MPDRAVLEHLKRLVHEAARHSFVPYSKRAAAAILLLSDGRWIPGVRVESASFSLTITTLPNAFSTAVALGRTDVVAIALDRATRPEERAYLETAPFGTFEPRDERCWVTSRAGILPTPGGRLSPWLPAALPGSAKEGLAIARALSTRALVPESGFRVACAMETDAGKLLPGVNVEHADWTKILCAERNVLGTAVSYAVKGLSRLYLTCGDGIDCTPCGACRQLLAELAPAVVLTMDRADGQPEEALPASLLPGFFSGSSLARGAGRRV